MRYILVADGDRYRISWGCDGLEQFRGREYFRALGERDQVRFETRFYRMVDEGRIANRAHYLRRGRVSCFGAGAHRLAAVIRPVRHLVLVDGFLSVGSAVDDLDRAADLVEAVLQPEHEETTS